MREGAVDWRLLDRDALLIEKAKWDTQLTQANQELQAAKQRAADHGQYLGIGEWAALQRKRNGIAAGVRGLQTEIARRNAERKELARFERFFFDAADELLDDDTYNKVYDRAKELQAQGALD